MFQSTVVGYRDIFLKNRWINSSCGGLAFLVGRTLVYHLPSDHKDKFRINRDDVIPKHIDGTDVVDDVCSGLWIDGFKSYGAGAIAHTVSSNALLISRTYVNEFVFDTSNDHFAEVMNQHMVDGKYRLPIISDEIGLSVGLKCCDQATEPFINNPAREIVLPFGMKCADASSCPRRGIVSSAVLIKGHGLFVFGKTAEETIKKCEALEAMFKLAIKMKTSTCCVL